MSEVWRARPVQSFLVRFVAFAAPVAAAIIAGILVSRLLGEPSGFWGTVSWWALVVGASLAALFLVERLARRLLPLAVLLRLTLAFPDQAPSRYKVALRSGSTKLLQSQIEAARSGDSAGEVAELILSLTASLATHDRATRGHAERTRAYAEMIGEELHLNEHDRNMLRWASLLHDIGKLEVAAEILNKPSTLDETEWERIRSHPEDGFELTKPLHDFLGEWADVILMHHEWYDGSGYPSGIMGEEIALGARIVAVADAYDAMTAARSYQKPISAGAARQRLLEGAEVHFDPGVVRAFLALSVRQLRWVQGPLALLIQVPFIGGLSRLGQTGSTVGTAVAAVAGLALGGVITASVAAFTIIAAPAAGGFDPTSLQIIEAPLLGNATIGADGEIMYSPFAGMSGEDSFVYVACDGDGRCANQEVLIDVAADGTVSLRAGAGDRTITIGSEGQTVTVLSGPDSGQVEVLADGLVYTPDLGFTGTDTLSVETCNARGMCTVTDIVIAVDPDASTTSWTPPVSDDSSTTTTTVPPSTITSTSTTTTTTTTTAAPVTTSTSTSTTTTLAPQSAPTAVADSVSLVEDGTVVIDVLANDSDPDGDIAAVRVSVPPKSGTATVGSNKITYSPNADFHGNDSLTYEVCDAGGRCAVAGVVIVVTSVPDAPVAQADSTSATEDVSKVVAVVANDSDADGDISTVKITKQGTLGTATVSGTEVTYTPKANLNGSDSFTYEVCDATSLCDTADVSVVIAPVADAPTAVADSATVVEGSNVKVNVAANDSDVDGDLVTSSVVVTSGPSDGSAVANGDGTVTYTPNPGFAGSDSFLYRICDSTSLCATATVTVTVTDVPEPPVAVADSATTNEDMSVSINVAANDSDPDGDLDLSSISIISFPSQGTVSVTGGGFVTYFPAANTNGSDSFVYRICDSGGRCAAATVSVTIVAVPDAPKAVNDTATTTVNTAVVVAVSANDSDPDGDLDIDSISIVTTPANGMAQINGSGAIRYTPDGGFTGSDSYVYRICDFGGNCSQATVSITVL
ncbi:MAG: tandem-95 repeat protein [Acidimicrobiia bacterium]|nr:tandem-95 repeat protein [Acidimicrobiia bacterium]